LLYIHNPENFLPKFKIVFNTNPYNFEIMKIIKQTLLAALFGALLMSNSLAAQEKELLVTVTTLHWNMDMKNFSMDEWKASEKEYFEKVTKKNELVIGQEVLTHYFTADNTEVLLVNMYDSWDAIEKAGARTDELIKAGWPDEKARKAFFDKKNSFYGPTHSDEILSTFEGAKRAKAKFDKSMLYYVRKSHWALPTDGTNKEFKELRNKYLEAVTYKNDFIKAYYPNVHAWGSNNTEFTEVFVVESLADVAKGFDKDDELFKVVWNDDKKSKDFDDRYNKYFTGVHGDYIYHSVFELSK
jgi:hypothetical protein